MSRGNSNTVIKIGQWGTFQRGDIYDVHSLFQSSQILDMWHFCQVVGTLVLSLDMQLANSFGRLLDELLYCGFCNEIYVSLVIVKHLTIPLIYQLLVLTPHTVVHGSTRQQYCTFVQQLSRYFTRFMTSSTFSASLGSPLISIAMHSCSQSCSQETSLEDHKAIFPRKMCNNCSTCQSKHR